MTHINCNVIHTEPGVGELCPHAHPFAPPSGWQGDRDAYQKLMRERWSSREWQQFIVVFSWHSRQNLQTFSGPFATEAKAIIERVSYRVKPVTQPSTKGEQSSVPSRVMQARLL